MTTPNLALEQVPSNSLQPGTAVNDALQVLDATVQPVAQALTNTPPTTVLADVGKAWLIGAAPTGVWAGKAGQVALCTAAATWRYLTPGTGWRYDVGGVVHRYAAGAWTATPTGATNLSGSGDATTYTVASDTGTDAIIPAATNAAAGVATAAQIAKLEGIEAGATANDTNANLRARSTHTGSQAASTISDLLETVQDIVAAMVVPGSNVTATYDDTNGTLTIAATAGGTGDVVGPASSVTDQIALFDGTTGKLLKDSGETVASMRRLPQNSQSAAYTLVLADAGGHLYHPSADTTARTWTIPANASVAFPIGTAITFVNDTGAGAITIAITSDTLVLAGAGTTGSRTLAANGIATAIKVTATRWIINGTGLT